MKRCSKVLQHQRLLRNQQLAASQSDASISCYAPIRDHQTTASIMNASISCYAPIIEHQSVASETVKTSQQLAAGNETYTTYQSTASIKQT